MAVKASLKLPLKEAEGVCSPSFAITACFHSIFCFAVGSLYLASPFSAGVNKVSSYLTLTEDEWWGCCRFEKRGFIDVILPHSVKNLSGTANQDLTQKAPYNQPPHWGTCSSSSPWTMLVLPEQGRSCSRRAKPGFQMVTPPHSPQPQTQSQVLAMHCFCWMSSFNIHCRTTCFTEKAACTTGKM